MNRLQKHSWLTLGFATFVTIIGILCVSRMRNGNAQGLIYIIIIIVIGGPSALWGILLEKKIEAKYDERELSITRRASRWSTHVVVAYAALLCFIAFFLVGGKGSIAVYYLPVCLFVGLFLGQLVQSAAILIQCAMESDDVAE